MLSLSNKACLKSIAKAPKGQMDKARASGMGI